MNIKPFVKWVGGKRQLFDQIKDRMPIRYNNYFEAFVGGGSLLFGLQPDKATINDINKALINTYKVIANYPEDFIELVDYIDSFSQTYNELRSRYNNKLSIEEYDIELAALFVFLNKHCFNGLYRVNSQGLFDTPWNRSYRKSINKDNIRAVSTYLKSVNILNSDFETACSSASKCDFIFLDSPYFNTYRGYTSGGFTESDHLRLANLYKSLTDKGCYCMLTNSNEDFIKDLYKNYNIDVIQVRRSVNPDGSNRKGEEIIITNYENSYNQIRKQNIYI